MSLNWDWNEKVGEVTVMQMTKYGLKKATSNLYEGNAFLIFIDEFEEEGVEKWNLWSFWVDETHAKRMLGLDKKYETYGKNFYEKENFQVTKFRINKAKSRNWKKIVKLLVDAFEDIDIDLYTDKGE